MTDPDLPGISVIVPCYGAAQWLGDFVASLAAQTLTPTLFEVVLVFNGPDDGGSELAARLFTEAGLDHQILASPPGAPIARNAGTAHARRSWQTFVDIDDQISPNYLEALWRSATSQQVIPVATMVDVTVDGEASPSTAGTQVLEHSGVVSPAELWRPMSVTVLKLIPTALARRHPFDETLRSGEDVALFFAMFEEEDLDFDTTPAHDGAVYRRLVRPGSVGRQNRGYDFMVTQRLEVIGILERALTAHENPRLGDVIETMIASQADMIRAFVRENPGQRDEVIADIASRELPHFPWSKIPHKTDRLIIAYTFAPFSDPSTLVTLKRAIESGLHYNAISADMSANRTIDTSVARMADEVVVEHRTIDGPTSFGNWPGIERFCLEGMAALEDIERCQEPQRHVYSRAMWPASHFLAALIKARRPDTEWTAEFSDPLRTNIHGGQRPGPIGQTEITGELAAAAARAGWDLPADGTVFEWAELLPYTLADRIVFTNPHQMSTMLGYLDDPALRERVLDRAVISPQPTLPAEYYERGKALPEPDPGLAHLAYFGSFYATRGLGDVLEGLRLLSPEQAARIKLHVFTGNQQELAHALEGHPYRGSVVAYLPLSYLDFLSATNGFDVLIVNDAITTDAAHRLNPYLPSKLSDYLGSSTPIWGIVEPGSMLSRHELAYSTRVGDASAAAEVLSGLADKERP